MFRFFNSLTNRQTQHNKVVLIGYNKIAYTRTKVTGEEVICRQEMIKDIIELSANVFLITTEGGSRLAGYIEESPHQEAKITTPVPLKDIKLSLDILEPKFSIGPNKSFFTSSEGMPLIAYTRLDDEGNFIVHDIKVIDSITPIKHKKAFAYTSETRPGNNVVVYSETEDQANQGQSVFEYFHAYQKHTLSQITIDSTTLRPN